MKVLVYGSINIDYNYRVDHIVVPGETGACTGLTKTAGGKGENQAMALARAGLDVYLAGKIGSDGLFLLDKLKENNVNTSFVMTNGTYTGQAIIQLDKNGQNAIFLLQGGNSEIKAEEIEKTLSAFGSGDMVVLQNEIVRVGEIISLAKKRGMKVCLNPSPCNELVDSYPLDMVDVFFINEVEGAMLAGMNPAAKDPDFAGILEKAAGLFPKAEIILTAGKRGAFYAFKDVRESSPIVDVKVVDTVGAGDTFSGYFIAAREKGCGVKEALDIANKAASISVSRSGAIDSVPFAKEVF
jgi:ribokinase